MKEMLQYLQNLEINNNREWFHAHKPEYKAATAVFERVVQALIWEIGKTDSAVIHHMPKELTFRVARDTRFGKDKSPYNPCFRAHIGPKGKSIVPVGYYICMMPGNRSFIGGGLFADMFRDATAMMRDAIAAKEQEWQRILTDEAFCKYFTVRGAKLKNVPAGYDKAHPHAEYLKHKSWYIEYPIPDEMLLSDSFITDAASIMEAMQPFNRFLNEALRGFTLPQRPK